MRLLTIKQAAAELGVHPNTLRRWADNGTVPVTKLPSGYRRWSAEQIAQIKQNIYVTGEAEHPEDAAA